MQRRRRGLQTLMLLTIVTSAGIAGTGERFVSKAPWAMTPSAINAVSIADAEPIQLLWRPKNSTAVIHSLSTMLKEATLTNRTLPKSAHATFFANMGPAKLTVRTASGQVLEIYPLYSIEHVSKHAFALRYQPGTVVFQRGDTREYLKDPALYRWLKSDWQGAFVQDQKTQSVSIPDGLWT